MSKPFNEFGPFAVGEVCRIVWSDSAPQIIGTEVKITSAPGPRKSINGEKWIGYGTDLCVDGIPIHPPEDYLRRVKPPASDASERMHMQRWREMADKVVRPVGETA